MSKIMEIGPLYYKPSAMDRGTLADRNQHDVICLIILQDYFELSNLYDTRWFIRIALSKPKHDDWVLVRPKSFRTIDVTDRDDVHTHPTFVSLLVLMRRLDIIPGQQYYVWLEEEMLDDS